MVLEAAGGAPPPGPGAEAVSVAANGATLAELCPTWFADAAGRLTRTTLKEYDRVVRKRIEPRFGSLPLVAIRPRAVSQRIRAAASAIVR